MTILQRRKSLHKYATRVLRYHKGISSVKRLVKDLSALGSPLNHFLLDVDLGCRPCFVPRDIVTCPAVNEQLPAINEFLFHLGLEVQEVAPGQLAIRPFRYKWRFRKITRDTKLAAVVLHWLLAEHTCVKRIEGMAVIIRTYPDLLFDGLRRCKSLTTLRFSKCWMLTGTVRSIMYAARGMPHLVELAFESCRVTTAAWDYIATYVTCTETLEALTLTGVSISCHSARQIIDALQQNTSISKLTVSSAFLAGEAGWAFYWFLSTTTLLEDLTVTNDCRLTDQEKEVVFEALREGSTLVKLTMIRFNFDLINAHQFSWAVRLSVSLQEVRFPECNWNLPPTEDVSVARMHNIRELAAQMGYHYRVLPFARALLCDSLLRKLSFSGFFSNYDCRLLLEAARDSASLELLTFDKFGSPSMEYFYQMLWETGTSEKVSLGECRCVSAQLLPAMSSCGALLDMGRHRLAGLDAIALREMSVALKLHDHISALDLRLTPEHDKYINRDDALELATYLATTTALKAFYLRLGVPDSVVLVILEGLCANRTIEKLDLEGMKMCESGVKSLCAWLGINKTTYHFGYHDGYFVVTTQLRDCLTQMLLSGVRTLTFVQVPLFPFQLCQEQALQHLVRCNEALLEYAAQFVLGLTNNLTADAFEQLSWHPQLPSKVQQAGYLTPTQVAQKLEESSERLQRDFWKMAGVVRERLACHAPSDGAKQIGDLGTRELRCVQSYLNVADVLVWRPKASGLSLVEEAVKQWRRQQRTRQQKTSDSSGTGAPI